MSNTEKKHRLNLTVLAQSIAITDDTVDLYVTIQSGQTAAIPSLCSC